MRHSIRDFRPAVERLEERAMLSASPLAPADSYVQTNLVSNVAGVARITDPELVDPGDVNFPQLPGINPPVVVADQGTGVATSYQISPDGLTVMESSFAGGDPHGRLQGTERPYRRGPKYAPQGILDPRVRRCHHLHL